MLLKSPNTSATALKLGHTKTKGGKRKPIVPTTALQAKCADPLSARAGSTGRAVVIIIVIPAGSSSSVLLSSAPSSLLSWFLSPAKFQSPQDVQEIYLRCGLRRSTIIHHHHPHHHHHAPHHHRGYHHRPSQRQHSYDDGNHRKHRYHYNYPHLVIISQPAPVATQGMP